MIHEELSICARTRTAAIDRISARRQSSLDPLLGHGTRLSCNTDGDPQIAPHAGLRCSSLMDRSISFLGLFAFIGIAWLISANKRRFPWRVVIGGLILQFTFAALILLTSPGRAFFDSVDGVFNALMDCVDAGSKFVFGDRFQENYFAFRVLPSIIFFSALMQLLYHVGVMQPVVRGLGWVVQRTLGTTGPESLAAAANIFVGQTEVAVGCEAVCEFHDAL